jgi:hypothetical protein
MDRTKYIIVFQDVTVWNPERRDLSNLYKAYLPAEHLMSAELMAKMVRGTVVGMLDNDGNEYYFEDGMEAAVRETAQSKFVFNAGVQLKKRKNNGKS